MKYLKLTLNWFLDNALAWFTPAWRRNSRETIAALKRYVNYNRHKLDTETITTCRSLQQELENALLCWNREECDRIIKQAGIKCEAMAMESRKHAARRPRPPLPSAASGSSSSITFRSMPSSSSTSRISFSAQRLMMLLPSARPIRNSMAGSIRKSKQSRQMHKSEIRHKIL